jgi:DNA-directed RNA polymerase subunit alpha
MSTHTNVLLPSKPKIIKEEGSVGIYEIDGLYPGYGHTLGNSLRRIILSSIPGAAIVKVKIAGVEHEFSTIRGVKEDVIMILLNLKKIRARMASEGSLTLSLRKKGIGLATAGDIEVAGQLEILNPEQPIAELTEKASELDMEITFAKGLGFVSKEVLEKERVDIGTIALDAIFTPIRKANYEVENMRVGDRTDFNRLRLSIETDGSITPKEALETSITTMIEQLKAIVGFEEKMRDIPTPVATEETTEKENDGGRKDLDVEFLKTRIDSLNLSPRTIKALSSANIRTIGGLVRKKESDILEVDGLGNKGVLEIKKVLAGYGITLKQD